MQHDSLLDHDRRRQIQQQYHFGRSVFVFGYAVSLNNIASCSLAGCSSSVESGVSSLRAVYDMRILQTLSCYGPALLSTYYPTTSYRHSEMWEMSYGDASGAFLSPVEAFKAVVSFQDHFKNEHLRQFHFRFSRCAAMSIDNLNLSPQGLLDQYGRFVCSTVDILGLHYYIWQCLGLPLDAPDFIRFVGITDEIYYDVRGKMIPLFIFAH